MATAIPATALSTLIAAGLVVMASAEEPDFMNQVMPVICAATQNLTRRIWYLACVEYLMEYGLETDANYCFSGVNTQTWEEAFGFFCGDKEEDKHHFLMQCFSDRINENVMYDARDVDKMLQDMCYGAAIATATILLAGLLYAADVNAVEAAAELVCNSPESRRFDNLLTQCKELQIQNSTGLNLDLLFTRCSQRPLTSLARLASDISVFDAVNLGYFCHSCNRSYSDNTHVSPVMSCSVCVKTFPNNKIYFYR